MSDERDLNDLLRDGDLPEDIGQDVIAFDEWAESEDDRRPRLALGAVLKIDSLEELAQIALEPVEWLLEKLIPAAQVTLMAGAAKAGKSTLLLWIMALLCAGRALFAGYRAKGKPVTVMWLYEDAKRTLARRVAAASINDNFLAIGYREAARRGISKIDPIELADALVRFAASHGAQVLVIDTLRRWFRLDEKDDEQADALIAALQAAAEAEGVAVVIVHHTRKLGGRKKLPTLEDVRGSSALTAAADQIIIVHRRSRSDPNAPLSLLVEGRDLEQGFRVKLERDPESQEWGRALDDRVRGDGETKAGLVAAVELLHERTGKAVSRNAAVKGLRAAGGSVSNERARVLLERATDEGLLVRDGTRWLPKGKR